MTREISKRFAAIGDDLSPPKAKPAPERVGSWQPPPPLPAPKTREPVTELRPSTDMNYLNDLVRQQDEWRRRQNDVRMMVMKEFGPGLSSEDIDGIVQAEIEYDNATETMDAKGSKWWRERLNYIRDQARKKAGRSRLMPMPYKYDPSVFNTMELAQQQIADITGIKQIQDFDFASNDLLVRRQYPDGKVSVDRISRYDIMDNVPCKRCGQPLFYPDRKTYHLCTATMTAYR